MSYSNSIIIIITAAKILLFFEVCKKLTIILIKGIKDTVFIIM